jgi:Flp pilus assembly protein TadD
MPTAAPATSTDVQTAERFNQRGIEMAQAHRFMEAEALLRHAIATLPGLAKAYNNLGNVLDELRSPAEAEMAYRKAIQVAPDYKIAQDNLAAHLKAR